MRVQEVFNSILGLERARVVDVAVDPGGRAGVVVTVVVVGPHRCGCGMTVAGRYDSVVRRWRHLDVAGRMLWITARLARIRCPRCGRVVTEQVSWARPGARYTRDFEQHVAWLAQRMDIAAVARLMRCGWDAIGRIVGRVVADHLTPDRFEGLRRIGVDEVSYKRGRHFLTVVVDHDRRRVVWIGVGKSSATLTQFYDEIGPERAAMLTAVSMDGGPAYRSATAEAAPQARICLDPFHVMKWAGEALDRVFTDSRVSALRVELGRITGHGHDRQGRATNYGWATARHAIRAGRETLDAAHHKILRLLRRERVDLHRAWVLKEELRDLFTHATQRPPAPTSPTGSPAPDAAASGTCRSWPTDSTNSPTPSSPESRKPSPTPDSKAPTPAFESSKDAATECQTRTHS